MELPPALLRFEPHPYIALGAPYGRISPFCLRSGVVERLLEAQRILQTNDSDLWLIIFDAYRPIAVQQFMVDWTFADLLSHFGLDAQRLTAQQRSELVEQVHRFWAEPSLDPATPPPHSTGAAVDLTLADTSGKPVAMGGEIDEISERSSPDHYFEDPTEIGRRFHYYRARLRTAMEEAGFQQHPGEWWHFSYGDQLWAFYQQHPTAIYGQAQ
ncbi:M15 family metallopeptidase [Gloeobacter violaceus]|uniref:D-alanyl-D-alanine dipeptidase n=1 Tax=Gloeobacter violaceus (strain ATCC 29082 / PCC 7421) TaxID=251221 RepID=Q7NJM7_GLOVI|nr:M15 family metallopeptidase [Gloeobacter violaceus]BAC89746.1 D-alanyl-D-alanine dipeptidase [Gloeobacter violaceus PCC 7421]